MPLPIHKGGSAWESLDINVSSNINNYINRLHEKNLLKGISSDRSIKAIRKTVALLYEAYCNTEVK